MSNKCNKRRMWRLSLFLALGTAFVLISGGLAWFWQAQQVQHSRADAGNIIGGPSLSAANVDAIFARVGSPMVGTGKVVEQTSRQANIDDAFALAVWWVETNDGAAGVGRGDHNPGGVRSSAGYPVDGGNYTIYPSYATAISDWFAIMKSRYISRGLTSVYAISYPYVGTAGSGQWAGKVITLVARYRGEGTPPTPIATVVSSPTASTGVSSTPTSDMRRQRSEPLTPIQKTSQAPLATPVANSTYSTAPAPSQIHTTAAPAQALLVMLGLLTALLLALWSMKIRRKLPMPIPAVARYSDPITPLPPLYVNEFSPALERYSPELATLAPAGRGESPSFSTAFTSAAEVEQLPFPAMTSLPSWLTESNRYTRRQSTDPLPVSFGKREVAKRSIEPSAVSAWAAWPASRLEADAAPGSASNGNESATSGIATWPGTPLHGQTPAPVGASPAKRGGLLTRYAEGRL